MGETGLDYFYQKKNFEDQIKLFYKHIYLSKKLNKPLIIHSRNANQDTIKILQSEKSEKCRGVLHSFNYDFKTASKLLDMGFYISLSGIFTFKNSEKLRSVIKKIPLNRILLETDSPYLTPFPHRGKENQPSYIYYIAKYLSNLIKIDLEELSAITSKNFFKLFNLKENKSIF
ncbi:TatD family hydrolase [Buchnera aphidicola]|uniref:TatD family hydrolase n=1 Tax=Buchnera aphidicola TaxID=9 RepID=UPI00223751EC|nr:YchF/TatD family DNA exonuclease [Buchnera aphidicola]